MTRRTFFARDLPEFRLGIVAAMGPEMLVSGKGRGRALAPILLAAEDLAGSFGGGCLFVHIDTRHGPGSRNSLFAPFDDKVDVGVPVTKRNWRRARSCSPLAHGEQKSTHKSVWSQAT